MLCLLLHFCLHRGAARHPSRAAPGSTAPHHTGAASTPTHPLRLRPKANTPVATLRAPAASAGAFRLRSRHAIAPTTITRAPSSPCSTIWDATSTWHAWRLCTLWTAPPWHATTTRHVQTPHGTSRVLPTRHATATWRIPGVWHAAARVWHAARSVPTRHAATTWHVSARHAATAPATVALAFCWRLGSRLRSRGACPQYRVGAGYTCAIIGGHVAPPMCHAGTPPQCAVSPLM